jgi:hypothetical protein
MMGILYARVLFFIEQNKIEKLNARVLFFIEQNKIEKLKI